MVLKSMLHNYIGRQLISPVTWKCLGSCARTYFPTSKRVGEMDPQAIGRKPDVAAMAYSNCKTRIINLQDLNLPSTASEEEYRRIYDQISTSGSPSAQLLTDAVNSIRLGIAPPVAFPTETVYGLGADATNRASTAGIFAAKGRPSDNPLIVHVASKEHLERLIGRPIPSVYDELVKEYWPGPLTVLVPVPENSIFASNVHPGQCTIGFRVPDSKYARFFIAATGRPLAAPSANSSGKPSPTRAHHVKDDLEGKINFILDGGSCDVGVESTVVDGLYDPPTILRPGGVSQDDLIAHGVKHNNAFAHTGLGYKFRHHASDNRHETNSEPTEAPRAPGMKYKHYAPHGKLTLFEGFQTEQQVHTQFQELLRSTTSPDSSSNSLSQQPLNIAILTSATWLPFANIPIDHPTKTGHVPNSAITLAKQDSTVPKPSIPRATYTHTDNTTHNIITINLGTTPKQIAQSLFAALRICDDEKCHYIFAEAPEKPSSKLNFQLKHTDTTSRNEGRNIEGGDHHYDAVIERMRKGASNVVVFDTGTDTDETGAGAGATVLSNTSI